MLCYLNVQSPAEMKETLVSLRQAISEHHWSKCERILRAILEQMDLHDAIKLALDHVKAYLPVFEHYHPEVA
jgi:hypothetical protein